MLPILQLSFPCSCDVHSEVSSQSTWSLWSKPLCMWLKLSFWSGSLGLTVDIHNKYLNSTWLKHSGHTWVLHLLTHLQSGKNIPISCAATNNQIRILWVIITPWTEMKTQWKPPKCLLTVLGCLLLFLPPEWPVVTGPGGTQRLQDTHGVPTTAKSQQPTQATHRNNYMPRPSGIYPKNARLAQHARIN